MGERPEFSPDYRQLVIFEEAVRFDISSDELRALASEPSEFSKEARRAFVVPGNLGFGIARMFELSKADLAGKIYVTRDLSDAQRWLDSDVTP